jgi:RimJ/RimL family protein N-acetyltransferase
LRSLWLHFYYNVKTMSIILRPITFRDIETCQHWAREIKVEQYQSRFYPKTFNGNDISGYDLLRCWYIILADSEEVGTVWLEKHAVEDEVAILGIMLGNKEKFGKGIGRAAILQTIKQSRPQLGFLAVELNVRKINSRAIACYRHCGFNTICDGIKIGKDGNEIPYLTMRLDLQ